MSTLYANLGLRLKLARESCDLTQSKVASYLGVKREQISYYETGSREIDLVTLNKLSDLYGYETGYFLSNSEVDASSNSVELAFRASGLDDKDLEILARSHTFLKNLNWIENILSKR
ncbi:helix-turn-helix domain-containing protein [Mesobacillus jeotgali]|uniref:helix-turn-helix domain-containing protein n=1 Tax=Mesobacillus jeotgali TaxID=129985 RepID=UPI00177CDB3B|nr:helix-turn-helix transcriptional regulator [Mesobacillus jeotgali]UYZ22025.1 helix-turn-helix domain-containing protein [Mesobacillus jeotgali]